MIHMQSYFAQATDPKQYDKTKLHWQTEGYTESPTRAFFYEYLEPELNVKGKKVLDIGSGMGPLFGILKNKGAAHVIGIEPSSQHVEISKKLHPDITVIHETFETAQLTEKFDAIIAVMVFEHIANPSEAFTKIYSLLEPRGAFYLITTDSDYYSESRSGYKVTTEQVDENTYAVETVRESTGTMYDLVRPVSWYKETADNAGLKLQKHIGLKPTSNLIQAAPRYAVFKDRAICHLLVFKKT